MAKIKCFEFTKENPFIGGFQYDNFSVRNFIDLRTTPSTKRKIKRHVDITRNSELTTLYAKMQSKAKEKKNLIHLCKKNVITISFPLIFLLLTSYYGEKRQNSRTR